MKRSVRILKIMAVLLIAAIAIPFVTDAATSIFDGVTAFSQAPHIFGFDGATIIHYVPGFAIGLATVPLITGIETSKELKEKRAKIWDQMQAINTLSKTEKRNLTDDEKTNYDTLKSDWDKLTERITEVEGDEKRAATMAGQFAAEDQKKQEKKEIRSYSLFKAIKAKAEGRNLDGIELEMHQEAEREARAIGHAVNGLGVPSIVFNDYAERRAMSATGQTSTAGDQGGMLIPTDKEGLIMALRPQLILAKLGAKMFGGMVGNLDLVKGSSTTVAWEAENGDADETSVLTSKISVTPRRLAAFTKIGKQLLAQTSQGLQDDVLNDLLMAIGQAVEVAAINGSGSGNNQPTGLLSTSGIGSVVGGTDGAAPTYAHITQLEAKVELGNAYNGVPAYLTNPKVKNALKNTKLDSGSGLYIWGPDSNILNGHPAYASNLVPSTLTKGNSSGVCSAIIFGDFTNMHIYNWAGLDITVDPYTLAGSHQIKLTVNSFWDIAIKHPAAFAAMLDATTTL